MNGQVYITSAKTILNKETGKDIRSDGVNVCLFLFYRKMCPIKQNLNCAIL